MRRSALGGFLGTVLNSRPTIPDAFDLDLLDHTSWTRPELAPQRDIVAILIKDAPESDIKLGELQLWRLDPMARLATLPLPELAWDDAP